MFAVAGKNLHFKQNYNSITYTSIRKLVKIIDVSKDTIYRLKTNEQNLREEWSSTKKSSHMAERKRKKGGKNREVDEVLNLWFSTVTQ